MSSYDVYWASKHHILSNIYIGVTKLLIHDFKLKTKRIQDKNTPVHRNLSNVLKVEENDFQLL